MPVSLLFKHKMIKCISGWYVPVSLFKHKMIKCISGWYVPVCLFVLRFYGPVNPVGSCRVLSVYLTTRLLGRLSPLSG